MHPNSTCHLPGLRVQVLRVPLPSPNPFLSSESTNEPTWQTSMAPFPPKIDWRFFSGGGEQPTSQQKIRGHLFYPQKKIHDKSFCCLCLLQRPPTFLKKNLWSSSLLWGICFFSFVDRGAKLISAKRWHNSSRIFAAAWIVVRSRCTIFWRIHLVFIICQAKSG